MFLILKTFQNECGFSDEDMSNLWNRVKNDLKQPKNAIGLKGPSTQVRIKVKWSDWLNWYINDTGLVEEYWGVGTERKWNWTTNKEDVRKFLMVFVKVAAQTVRNSETSAKKAKESRESPSRSTKTRILAKDRKSTSPSTIKLESPTTHDTRKAINPHLKSSVLVPQNSTSNKSDHAPKQVIPISKRPLKRRRTSDSGLTKGKEGDSAFIPAKPSKKQASLWRDEPPSSDIGPVTGPEVSTTSNSNTMSPVPMEVGACLKNVSVLAEIAFETQIAGTNRLRIIHATQAPTLELFITMVYDKFRLALEQRILSIDVLIGNDLLAVDLWEEKDWAHIIKRALENGSCKAKVQVEMVST